MRTLLVIALALGTALGYVDEMGCVGDASVPPPPSSAGPNLPEVNWTTLTDMPTPRFGIAAGAVDGLVYCVGGYGSNRLTLNEVYDPAGDTWATRTSMVNARNGCAGAVVNGKFYVVGGYNGTSRLNIVEEYDPVGDSWHTLPVMRNTRTVPAAVGLGGKLYVLGGFDGVSYMPSVERYDPATGTWDSVASMINGRGGAAATVLGGKIYVIGGWAGIEPTLSEAEVFNPDSNSWSLLPSIATGRMYAQAAAMGGYVFILGGQLTFGGGYTDEVEAYDPAANDWTASTPMPLTRGSHGAAAIGNRTYVIAGWNGALLAQNDCGELQTGIAGPVVIDPRQPRLSASPNPFRTGTVLSAAAGRSTTVEIHDAAGRLVRKLSAAGPGVAWDGRDESGRPVPAGVYLARDSSRGGLTLLVTRL